MSNTTDRPFMVGDRVYHEREMAFGFITGIDNELVSIRWDKPNAADLNNAFVWFARYLTLWDDEDEIPL